jgi:hypothetical protein
MQSYGSQFFSFIYYWTENAQILCDFQCIVLFPMHICHLCAEFWKHFRDCCYCCCFPFAISSKVLDTLALNTLDCFLMFENRQKAEGAGHVWQNFASFFSGKTLWVGYKANSLRNNHLTRMSLMVVVSWDWHWKQWTAEIVCDRVTTT